MPAVRLSGVDQAELEALAVRLGRCLRGGQTLLLEGEMGSGKTTFTRALARGMGVADPARVCSPSYTVCMVHAGPVPLVHVDLFRLGDPEMVPPHLADAPHRRGGAAAFEALGLEHDELDQAMGVGRHVLVVEWSSWWDSPPAERLEIRLSQTPTLPDRRDLVVTAAGEACPRLLEEWLGGRQKAD